MALGFGFCVARSITKQFQLIWAKNIEYILYSISTYQKIYFKNQINQKNISTCTKIHIRDPGSEVWSSATEIFISQRAVYLRGHSQTPAVPDNTDVSGSSLPVSLLKRDPPCDNKVKAKLTVKMKTEDLLSWTPFCKYLGMCSTNNFPVSGAPTALLNSPTTVAHFCKGFVCKTVWDTKVILSRFPISSAGNNFSKLKVLGLILIVYIVVFWKVHVVGSPHLFAWMHVELLKSNMIFSVDGRTFYAAGIKTFMSIFCK